MFTNNKFYIGDYFIPQAKPSISDEALGVNNEFKIIVERSEETCLINCFGNSLYRELISNIDLGQETLIKVGSDDKWNKLVNGEEFIKQGETKKSYWTGLRYKSPLSSVELNASLLTGYVYYMYNQNQFTTSTSTGEKRINSANASNTVPTAKVVKAWNSFVDQVQGKKIQKEIVENYGLIGFDYFKGDYNISLYDYINYKNKINNETFLDFTPKEWHRINSFNL